MAKRNKTGKTIVVRIEGKFIAWTDGQLSGDEELVRQAEENALVRDLVLFPRQPVLANLDDPAGAIAAMWGISPGRAAVVEGYPKIVLELFGSPERDPSLRPLPLRKTWLNSKIYSWYDWVDEYRRKRAHKKL